MSAKGIPFQSLRQRLYTADELFGSFDASPGAFRRTLDFQIYQHFIATGGASPKGLEIATTRATHDATITQLTNALLDQRGCVAIMGGHKLRRDSETYRSIAHLSRKLTRAKLLVASGGGPGAMEASHLGARMSGASEADLDAAIARLADAKADLPTLTYVVREDGSVDSDLVAAAQEWFEPAIALARETEESAATSLSVPTWHYGFEPTTPFATHIAKYFQNSIREDGLLAIALRGIVFAEGAAGTLQEVFQDAAQNYYHSFGKRFSPMVFFGTEYWTKTLPVRPLLDALFALKPERKAEAEKLVSMTDSIDQVVETLTHTPLPDPEPAGALPALAEAQRHRL
jgi:hypothetical protein